MAGIASRELTRKSLRFMVFDIFRKDGDGKGQPGGTKTTI
jgi:hypothetical protein